MIAELDTNFQQLFQVVTISLIYSWRHYEQKLTKSFIILNFSRRLRTETYKISNGLNHAISSKQNKITDRIIKIDRVLDETMRFESKNNFWIAFKCPLSWLMILEIFLLTSNRQLIFL